MQTAGVGTTTTATHNRSALDAANRSSAMRSRVTGATATSCRVPSSSAPPIARAPRPIAYTSRMIGIVVAKKLGEVGRPLELTRAVREFVPLTEEEEAQALGDAHRAAERFLSRI